MLRVIELDLEPEAASTRVWDEDDRQQRRFYIACCRAFETLHRGMDVSYNRAWFALREQRSND